MIHVRSNILGTVLTLALAIGLTSCDSVQPDEDGSLVVETFMSAGQRPSHVLLRTTVPLDRGAGAASRSVAAGATVVLDVNGVSIRYEEPEPGRYVPPVDYLRLLQPGDGFVLEVQWQEMSARASGTIPPPIRLDSMTVTAPLEPVEAILVDSLRLDTLGVDATTGLIYPVETTLWWTTPAVMDPGMWVHAQLDPRREFSSVVVDFFLLPEEVLREIDVAGGGGSPVSWTGLYAVPVDGADEPLPVHELRVALVRSDKAYADFAGTRSDSGGREPVSNVGGGLGIAVGLSVDSVTVRVDPALVGRKSIVF